jgi:hypothetical protein
MSKPGNLNTGKTSIPSKPPDESKVLANSDLPDVSKVNKDVLDKWIRTLYDVNMMGDDELNSYYETIQYRGYNRELVLKQLLIVTGGDQTLAAQMIIAIALRGPRIASQLRLRNGKSCAEMGIAATGGKGSDKFTCNKIQAATADLAAFYLKRLVVPKRVNIDLPGWLQFPSAASIKMPDLIRKNHRIFAETFSSLIGGKFNEQIYEQMAMNAYLDPALNLFA